MQPDNDFPHPDPIDLRDAKRGGWALLEIFGHRQHYGFVQETSLFGGAMVIVLEPYHDKPGISSEHVYGGAAVFSCKPLTKAACLEAHRPTMYVGFDRPQLSAAAFDGDVEEDESEERDGDADDGPREGQDIIVLREGFGAEPVGALGKVQTVSAADSFSVKLDDKPHLTICMHMRAWRDVVGPAPQSAIDAAEIRGERADDEQRTKDEEEIPW